MMFEMAACCHFKRPTFGTQPANLSVVIKVLQYTEEAVVNLQLKQNTVTWTMPFGKALSFHCIVDKHGSSLILVMSSGLRSSFYHIQWQEFKIVAYISCILLLILSDLCQYGQHPPSLILKFGIFNGRWCEVVLHCHAKFH